MVLSAIRFSRAHMSHIRPKRSTMTNVHPRKEVFVCIEQFDIR